MLNNGSGCHQSKSKLNLKHFGFGFVLLFNRFGFGSQSIFSSIDFGCRLSPHRWSEIIIYIFYNYCKNFSVTFDILNRRKGT